MPQQPHRRLRLTLAQGCDPGADIAGIVVDGHLIGIGNRPGTVTHATLVDAQAADALGSEAFGQ
ncbi:hypothetical protein D3C76_983470 [compost metagenome]